MKRLLSSKPNPSSGCSCLIEPRVVIVNTWVSPRVNRPEPWVRGRSPISQLMGLTSVRLRPPIRCALSRILLLISVLTFVSKAESISSSGNCSPRLSTSCFFRLLSACSRCSFSGWLKASVSLPLIIGEMAEITSGLTSVPGASILGLPQACWSCSCSLIISWFASCPNLIACMIISSETSWLSASSIIIISLMLATMRSSRLLLSWANVGFNISSSLI